MVLHVQLLIQAQTGSKQTVWHSRAPAVLSAILQYSDFMKGILFLRFLPEF